MAFETAGMTWEVTGMVYCDSWDDLKCMGSYWDDLRSFEVSLEDKWNGPECTLDNSRDMFDVLEDTWVESGRNLGGTLVCWNVMVGNFNEVAGTWDGVKDTWRILDTLSTWNGLKVPRVEFK